MSHYRPDDYLSSLNDALNTFERKLGDRWHDTINKAVTLGEPLSPAPLFVAEVSPGTGGAPWHWDYQQEPARLHFESGTCEALKWFDNGRQGKPEDIQCPGTLLTGWTTENGTVNQIDCQLGRMFGQTRDWAYQDRQIIFDELPLFAGQDVDILQTAWSTLCDMGAAFGLDSEVNDDGVEIDSPKEAFDTETSLPDLVDNLSSHGEGGRMKNWEIEWTGLAADRVKSGIFASTEPTLRNHALLAAYLAQMINLRATIITKHRADNLSLINGATESLGKTVEEPTSLSGLWKSVHFAGLTLSLVPGIAASKDWLKWVAFVGQEQFAEINVEDVTFRYQAGEVVEDLYQEVRKLKQALEDNHDEFDQQVAKLRDSVNGTPGTYLELYDLTENSPTGSGGPGRSFSVSISDVMGLASNSYLASEMYDRLRRRLADTDAARGHLTDKDGAATAADREIIALLDEFEQYLITTSARYYLAGEQIEAAARTYQETEDLTESEFTELDNWRADMREFSDNDISTDGLGDYEGPGDPGEAAEDTDRPADANDDIADGYETEESSAGPNKDAEKIA